MKNLKCIKYSSDKKEAWNAFLAGSKNGTFLFNRDFMEYHSDRFEDFSLMIYHEQKLVALFPANIKNDVVYSHQGLSYGGLLLNVNEKYKKTIFIFKEILTFLQNSKISVVEIKEIPSIYTTYPSDEILHLLFLCKAVLTRRDGLSVIDVQNDFKFSRDRKAGISRGIKSKLEIKEVFEFNEFWNEVLIPNLTQKHGVKPVHTLDEITELRKKFPKNIRQFNVYQNHKIIAGTTIFETQKVAHSQYISAKINKNETGSLDLLHNHLITEVFSHKNYFDFGISNEQGGKKINEGLQYWKESFGARMITQDFYRAETKNHKLLNDVLK
ncbi:GNAT family N-acetyltransferase [Wenyingzhuangia sp. IMCC45533]